MPVLQSMSQVKQGIFTALQYPREVINVSIRADFPKIKDICLVNNANTSITKPNAKARMPVLIYVRKCPFIGPETTAIQQPVGFVIFITLSIT